MSKFVTYGKYTGYQLEGSVAASDIGTKALVAITTVGDGVLTAAALISGLITRSGPTAAYTDTTDTATNIIAALDNPRVGEAFDFTIINGVAFIETIAAGTGVTLAGTVNNAASRTRMYRLTVNDTITPAVTIRGIGELAA